MRASRDSDQEIAAWREATNATTSFRMWKHATLLTAVRKKNAPIEGARLSPRIRQILHRAFEYGEPVWMAADEVAIVAKAEAKPIRTPREELRSAMAAYYTRRDPVDLDTFNAQLAKLITRLKKDAGAETIRQNYRGTGSQKHRRQLWVRFKSGAIIDLWLDSGFLGLGGVVVNRPPGSEVGLSAKRIPYGDKSPEEVYREALAVLKPWANPSSQRDTRASSRRPPARKRSKLSPQKRALLSRKIRKLRKEGYPQLQAVAVAHRMLGIEKPEKRASSHRPPARARARTISGRDQTKKGRVRYTVITDKSRLGRWLRSRAEADRIADLWRRHGLSNVRVVTG